MCNVNEVNQMGKLVNECEGRRRRSLPRKINWWRISIEIFVCAVWERPMRTVIWQNQRRETNRFLLRGHWSRIDEKFRVDAVLAHRDEATILFKCRQIEDCSMCSLSVQRLRTWNENVVKDREILLVGVALVFCSYRWKKSSIFEGENLVYVNGVKIFVHRCALNLWDVKVLFCCWSLWNVDGEEHI